MKLTFEEYLDKVYGCWLGKCVIGTLGAPYEGMKQLNHLTFKKEMIEEMLPNDDLDLQVVWLKVLEEVGCSITSDDLAKDFVKLNIKWPGEYAYFRSNYVRGIRPPYSGIINNDFYKDGMGCPIRAEIWGMILPGNPDLASELSRIDGSLDHEKSSIDFEAFFAGMISNAFFISDINELIDKSLKYVEKDSKAYNLIVDCVKWAKESDDLVSIRSKIIGKYGHSDCTNSYQNIGLTLLAILKSNYNPLEAGIIALNLGFDTDCTAGNSGSLLGLILGAKKLKEYFDIDKVNFKLNLRYKRKTDNVLDLAIDTCKVGNHFLNNYKNVKNILLDCPYKDEIIDKPIGEISISNYYDDGVFIEPNKKVNVRIEIKNNRDKDKELFLSSLTNSDLKVSLPINKLTLFKNEIYSFNIECVLTDKNYISQTNIITLLVKDETNKEYSYDFGLIGKRSIIYYGPFWENNFEINLDECNKSYGEKIKGVCVNEHVDNLRCYQLNMVTNFEREYLSLSEIREEKENRLYEYCPKQAFLPSYAFETKDFSSFEGPAVYYVKETINLPHSNRVCIFMGHTDNIELYVDGKLFIESRKIEHWTPENKHYYHFVLSEGDHEFIYKIDARTGNQKISFILNIDDESGQYPWTDIKTKLKKEV